MASLAVTAQALPLVGSIASQIKYTEAVPSVAHAQCQGTATGWTLSLLLPCCFGDIARKLSHDIGIPKGDVVPTEKLSRSVVPAATPTISTSTDVPANLEAPNTCTPTCLAPQLAEPRIDAPTVVKYAFRYKLNCRGKTQIVDVQADEAIGDFCERVAHMFGLACIRLNYRDPRGGGMIEVPTTDSVALVGTLIPDRSMVKVSLNAELQALRSEAGMLQWEQGRLSRELHGLQVLISRMRGQLPGEKSAKPVDVGPMRDDADVAKLQSTNKILRDENARLVRELKGMEAFIHRLTFDKNGGASGRGNHRSWRGGVVRGIVRPMPKDGNCLFHGLATSLGLDSATKLRQDICDFIEQHPDSILGGKSLRDWVLWESGQSYLEYVSSMRTLSEWGGPLEIAVCSHMMKATIHVYQEVPEGGFQRLVAFEIEGEASCKSVNLAFQPGHYDVLEVTEQS